MTDEQQNERQTSEPDPDSSPFERPAIAGMPFKRKSKEAKAIQRVIEAAEREHGPPD